MFLTVIKPSPPLAATSIVGTWGGDRLLVTGTTV
jgi:hypothetical protein